MTTPPVDLNSDVPSRSWNDTRIEALEPRLAAAGITLPASPEAPEMQGIYAQLSASDPELMRELQDSMAMPLADGVHEKISVSADRAAKAQRVKSAPMRMVSGPNHKNRIQVDGKLLGYIAGGVFVAGAIAFVFFNPSAGQTSSVATGQAPQGSGTAAQAGQPTVAAGSSAGTAPAGAAGTQPTTGTGATSGTPGAGGETSTPPLLSSQQVPPAVIQPVETGSSAGAPVVAPDPVPVRSASPAPMPYVPQQVTATPAPVSPAGFTAPARRTASAPAIPARVPLMALQAPPAQRTEPPRRVVALSAPLQRANRVAQSVPAEQQGATANPARSGVMASSAQVAPSRVSSSAASTEAPVAPRGLVSQGQASTPQATLGQGMSQQSAPSTGRSGLVAMGAASEPTARASQGLVSAAGTPGSDTAGSSRGLVSAAGGTGSETALQGQGEAPGGRGGLISLASARSAPGMTGQSQGQATDAPAAAAPQAATVLGGAAPAPVTPAPESPYAMGKQIKAVTDTGALFASVVGSDSAGVINGEDAQLIYATAEDGSVWRGTPRLLTSGRIGVTFDRVLIKGQAMKVLADATDGTGLPGVQAESHTDSPKLASELFQSVLSGARSFAQASLQGDTSITSNGTIVSQAAKPNFWVTLGGALAGSLSLPSARITQVNVTSLPKGTQIMLVVRGEQ